MERKRARTARALANDERILDAATSVIATRGIDRFGLRDVAAEAGLTYGALYGRYENSVELLTDLWERRLRGEFATMAETAATFARRMTADAALVANLQTPSAARRDAVAALIAAARIDELQDVVPRQVAAILAETGLMTADGGDPVGLGALGMLLGSAALDRVDGPLGVETATRLAEWLRDGQGEWAGPAPAPDRPAEIEFHTGDELRDRLLTAAISVVARSGVRGASLRRISRTSGYSQTAVYAIYPSLEALILDLVDLATRWTQQPALLGRTFTDPTAAAARVAGWVGRDAGVRRRLFHEFFLGAAHDPELAHLTASLDAELYGQVALEFGPAGSAIHDAVLGLLRAGRNANFGLTLLQEVVGGLEAVDWRPFAGAFIAGAMRSLGRQGARTR